MNGDEFGPCPLDVEPPRPLYKPGHARVGEPTPQTHPEFYTDDEIRAEARYLIRLNARHGTNPLRTAAYLRLYRVIADREAARRP